MKITKASRLSQLEFKVAVMNNYLEQLWKERKNVSPNSYGVIRSNEDEDSLLENLFRCFIISLPIIAFLLMIYLLLVSL